MNLETGTNNKPKRGKKFFIFVGIIAFLAFAAIFIMMGLEENDLGYYQVNQTITGKVWVRNGQGTYWKWPLTKTTTWRKVFTQYWSKHEDQGGKNYNAIEVQFGDSGVGFVSLNVRRRNPNIEPERIDVQNTFITEAALNEAVEEVARQAVQTTASMMTAEESYRRKPEFIAKVIDQIMHGLYVTRTVTIEENGEETVLQQVVRDKKTGEIKRQPRDIDKYGIEIANVNVTDLDYDKKTQGMIDEKRQKYQEAELAKYKAEKAKQEALAAEEEGKKDVIEARYQELEKKEKAVVQAEQKAQVAEIEAQQRVTVASKQKEQAAIDLETEKLKAEAVKVDAEAQAEAKRKLIEADGALDKKLAALVEINQHWAENLGKNRQVPDIMIGNEGKTEGGAMNAQNLMEMIMINTAKQLKADMKINQ